MRIRRGQIATVPIVTFLALALASSLAPFGGGRTGVVRSGSMSPAIGVGDLVLTSPVSAADLEVRCVVSYLTADSPWACHRIEAVDAVAFTLTMKGDANEDPAPHPVAIEAVEGRGALTIPSLGHAVGLIQGPPGSVLITVLGATVIMYMAGKGAVDGEADRLKGGST